MRFGATPAPILAMSNVDGQESVTIQVPFEIPIGWTPLTLVAGDLTATRRVRILPATPGIFQVKMSDSKLRGIVLRTDGLVDLEHRRIWRCTAHVATGRAACASGRTMSRITPPNSTQVASYRRQSPGCAAHFCGMRPGGGRGRDTFQIPQSAAGLAFLSVGVVVERCIRTEQFACEVGGARGSQSSAHSSGPVKRGFLGDRWPGNDRSADRGNTGRILFLEGSWLMIPPQVEIDIRMVSTRRTISPGRPPQCWWQWARRRRPHPVQPFKIEASNDQFLEFRGAHGNSKVCVVGCVAAHQLVGVQVAVMNFGNG